MNDEMNITRSIGAPLAGAFGLTPGPPPAPFPGGGNKRTLAGNGAMCYKSSKKQKQHLLPRCRPVDC
jgi:hypothetical protein